MISIKIPNVSEADRLRLIVEAKAKLRAQGVVAIRVDEDGDKIKVWGEVDD